MLGLYIHIPFCRTKCTYCNFLTRRVESPIRRKEFTESVAKEIKCYADIFFQRRFDTLYLGGGSPSDLAAEEIREIFSAVRKHFKFSPQPEITLEVNSGQVTIDKIKCYKDVGINRVSIGAQSFHEETLRFLNRGHTVKAIEESYQYLRDGGFSNINLDLMLGLPGESLTMLEESLKKALRLNPEHFSLYELVIEDRTVFKKWLQMGKLKVPDEADQLEGLVKAREFLKSHGYNQYELLNYAKSGFESRHNHIYWANEEYLGLGPGAFSYLNGRRFRFSRDYEEYIRKVQTDDWVVAEEETLAPEKRETESVLLALRLMKGADEQRFVDWVSRNSELVDDLKNKGLLARTAGRIYLTDKGQLFSETVFSEIAGVEEKKNYG